MTYLMSEGWRKVAEAGGTFIYATLYNVLTGEEASVFVRNYDRDCVDDCDNPEWYPVAIDESARRAWNRMHGRISAGDRALVIKGRKLAPGFSGVVERIRPVRDRFGRRVADYVVFADGSATNIENCVLIMD